MKVFFCYVGDTVSAQGVTVSQSSSECEDVHGQLYAVSAGGRFLERADAENGWHQSKQDALRVAADKVSRMARTLLAQAERLREEADGGAG